MAVARTDIAEPGGVVAGQRIITNFIHWPIERRDFDWAAWIDYGNEHGLVGFGTTEQAAKIELQELIDEDRT